MMYWVIHYANGVAITRADSYQEAEEWCVLHLGYFNAPFAITPGRDEDLAEGSDSTVCIDQPGFNDERELSSFLVSNNKEATRH